MTHTALDDLISNLGKTFLLGERELFRSMLADGTRDLNSRDLTYLQEKLHNPPAVPPEIIEREERLGLGQWMAICQHMIFELVYRLGLDAYDFLRAIAYGKYDWIQANALEILCLLYLDGKLPEDTISEIDLRLPHMRYETQLYFAQDLLKRLETDPRIEILFKKIRNMKFQLALAEMGHKEPLTREDLIDIGRRIVAAKESEEEIQELMELFDANVPYPRGSDLFYYPEKYNLDSYDKTEYNPTIEEIVDKCLNYGR